MTRSADQWGQDAEKSPVWTIIKGLVIVVLVVTAIGWFAQGSDFFMFKVFAPRRAAVERQVFENTPSYNKGMVQELENLQAQYVSEKDTAAKSALTSIILHKASGYNLNDPNVPQSLRDFIDQLKRGRSLTQ